MAEAPPPSLKHLLPYVQRAKEMEKADRIIAYYCRYHAIKLGIPSYGSGDAKTKAYLNHIMDVLEQDKKAIGPSTAISDDKEGAVYVENFAQKVFLNADNEDRAGKATKTTAMRFKAAATFFEIMGCFGELPADIAEKKRYCKWKAADIVRALNAGLVPTPGPPGGDVVMTDEDGTPFGAPGTATPMDTTSTTTTLPPAGGPGGFGDGNLPTSFGGPGPFAGGPPAPGPGGFTPAPLGSILGGGAPMPGGPSPFPPSFPPAGPFAPGPGGMTPSAPPPSFGPGPGMGPGVGPGMGMPPMGGMYPPPGAGFGNGQLPPGFGAPAPGPPGGFGTGQLPPGFGVSPSAPPPGYPQGPSAPPPAAGGPPTHSTGAHHPAHKKTPAAAPAPAPAPAPAAAPASYSAPIAGYKPTEADMQRAAKVTKFALSALQFNDVPTAITNLQLALAALQSGR